MILFMHVLRGFQVGFLFFITPRIYDQAGLGWAVLFMLINMLSIFGFSMRLVELKREAQRREARRQRAAANRDPLEAPVAHEG